MKAEDGETVTQEGSAPDNGALFFRRLRNLWKAPQKLQEANKRINGLKAELELLTSYSTDVIYRLRYDTMRYDYISPAVTRLLGFTPEELAKMNIRSLIDETRIIADNMRSIDSFTELEKNRESRKVSKWQADYLMRTRDGRKIWVSDISYPWLDESGAIIGSVGSLRDITERVTIEQNARTELERLANTDGLTGLSARHTFFDRLSQEMKRTQRSKHELSLLLLDVDHFKQVNDTHGHAAGDDVLVGIADIIRGCLRESDMAARIGGEEFGMILPDTPEEGAYWVAERIRSQVARHAFRTENMKTPVQLTVSIGIAGTVPGDGIDPMTLYKMADTRLYIAKNTGRNQVSVDEIVNMH